MSAKNNRMVAKEQNRQRTSTIKQRKLLYRAVSWILDGQSFADLQRHGNSTWDARGLIILAVLTAWCPHQRLTGAFEKAFKLTARIFHVQTFFTYQGMMRVLSRYGSELTNRLWIRMHLLMQEVSPDHFRIGKWVPLAVDGSRFTTPRTKSNERAFCAKNFGRGRDAKYRVNWKNKKKRSKKPSAPIKPQIWLTLVWHMGLKLLWCWKMGPSDSSERHHFIELLDNQVFPDFTLFCADAGFVGYELWTKIISSGHSFLIRVGGNAEIAKGSRTCKNRCGCRMPLARCSCQTQSASSRSSSNRN